MGKKGTKKKTKWQTLPIDSGNGGASAGSKDQPHGSTRDRQLAADKPFSGWRLQTSFSSQTSSLSTDKASASHSESLTNGHHGPPSYHGSRSQQQQQHRRRNAQHGSGRQQQHQHYYSRNYYGDRNSSDNRPTFNEDEYTRITTPRQDVLFKKGYLSRPKKYTNIACSSSVNDSATPSTSSSGSGAVSVTSIEDSTTPSTQSVSPEHCNSMSETSDPDYPYNMYPGFFDQNGVFYGYPCMPSNSGFDPYRNGQMMFMPYPFEFYHPSMVPPYEPPPPEDSPTIPPETESPTNEEDQQQPTIDEKTAETEDDAQGQITAEDDATADQEVPFIPPMFPPTPQPAFYFPPYVFAPPQPPPILPVYEDVSLYEKPLEESEVQDQQQQQQIVDELNNGIPENVQKAKNDDQNASTDALNDNVILKDPVKIALESTLNVEVQEFHPRRTNIPQSKINNNNNQDVAKKEQPVKKKQHQPYSQIITSRKLLQEATKSIQEQNIDLLKNNPLAANSTTAVVADVKWHTVVKPARGRKGKSIAVDEDWDSDDENREESIERNQTEVVTNVVDTTTEGTTPNGKMLSKKTKVSKAKKKPVVKKTNKKQSTGFEVIEPDFGQVVRINRKTEKSTKQESESEDDEVDDLEAAVATTISATADVAISATVHQESDDKESKVIDLCDDAECRILEAELQYIESILNLENVPEEVKSIPEESFVDDSKELVEKVPSSDCADIDPTSESKELTTLPEPIPETPKTSLLEAVTLWLDEQNKNNDKTADLLRLPDNPVILQRFYESAFPGIYAADGSSDSDSEPEEEEDTDTCVDDISNSKEPVKHQASLSEDDYIDTDSDYQSDNQQKNKSSCSSDHHPLVDGRSPQVDYKSSPNNNSVHLSQNTTPTPLLHAATCENNNTSSTTTYSKSPVLCILM